MPTLKLEADADLWFIINALRVAAETYRADAERMEALGDGLATMFRDREARALALADHIEAPALLAALRAIKEARAALALADHVEAQS